MVQVCIRLSKFLTEQIDGLVAAKKFDSRSDFVRQAVIVFLERVAGLKMADVELGKQARLAWQDSKSGEMADAASSAKMVSSALPQSGLRGYNFTLAQNTTTTTQGAGASALRLVQQFKWEVIPDVFIH